MEYLNIFLFLSCSLSLYLYFDSSLVVYMLLEPSTIDLCDTKQCDDNYMIFALISTTQFCGY